MLSSVFITGRPIFPKYAYRSNSFLINCFSTDVNVSFFKPKTVSPVSKENMFLDYKTTKIPNKEIIVNFEPIIIFLHLTAIERIHFNKELISSKNLFKRKYETIPLMFLNQYVSTKKTVTLEIV
jgi:hypothetical protein